MVSIDEIVRDRKSGQTAIIKKTLELLKGLDGKDRLNVCEKIVEAHRFMAGLKWVYKRLKEGVDIEEIEKEIGKDDKEAIKIAEEIADGKVVVTLSRSHTLEKGLLKASKVIVLESSPRKEGIEMARYLKGRGVDVRIFPDCAVAYAVKCSDVAVVGADAIYRNGIINKVGTLPLALCCKHFSKDCYVVAQRYKFVDEEFVETFVSDVFTEDMLFEFVPADLLKI